MFIFVCPKMNQKRQPFSWFDIVELPCAARNKQTPRKVANAPPSRFSAFCCAARLREIADTNLSSLFSQIRFFLHE
jgi:hypothetical protein